MKPYVIGFSGGSASGKSSIVQKLKDFFPNDIVIIHLDDYYKDQSHLSFEVRTQTNYDHPDAFDFDLLVTHLNELKCGHSIVKPLYDFKEHNRKSTTEKLSPKPIIIVDGLFTLTISQIANLCDLKIFVDTSADIRFIRRLERDMLERGRTLESVTKQYLTTVRPMHEQYIEPAKMKADLIILNGVENTAGLDVLKAKIKTILDKKGEKRKC